MWLYYIDALKEVAHVREQHILLFGKGPTLNGIV
jgi:hypothetical protein